MTIIKISGKSSNLSIRFEQPLHLKKDKTYKLGLMNACFREMCTQKIEKFKFRFSITVESIQYVSKEYKIDQLCSLDKLRKFLVTYIRESVQSMIETLKKTNKTVPKHLENIDYSTINLEVKSVANSLHTIQLRLPLKLEVLSLGNFGKILGFQKTVLMEGFLPYQLYISNVNPPFLKPLNLVEVHTNIIEYSYSNHSDNPHIHELHELLHVFSIEKPFPPGLEHIETPKEIVYVPLREGLDKISNIQIQLKDYESGDIIHNLDHTVIYLHLKEEN